MLVVEVFDRISKTDGFIAPKPEGKPHPIINELEHILKSKRRYSQLERFHDALQKKEEAYSLFNHGYLDLEDRAQAENLFWSICQALEEEKKESAYHPEELFELRKMLAEQYVCNFSVFQSLLDHWAFNQLFPVAPLHRLKEKPEVNAVLVDITCDSDGKISHFIDLEDVKDYLPLHTLNDKPYYLGVFLTGAYQDIMGDLHNLFGRVNEVHVFLEDNEEDGYYIEQTIRGNPISEILELIQYKENDLLRSMKRQIDRATKKNLVKPRQGTRLLDFYEDLIGGKTYLNIVRETKKKPARRAARKKT